MRRSSRLLVNTSRKVRCLSAVLLLAGCSAMRGQTQATTVPLVLPSALVFDAQGNLYFAETGNHVIRKFSVGAGLTTFAGSGNQGFAGDNGPAATAELDSPSGLAIDSSGNLYIADTHNHRVREVAAATGTISTVAGTGVAGFSGDGGAASAARLDLPTALAIDSAGDLYIADTDNHRVRRIAAGTGVITTVAGDGIQAFAGDNGLATLASIDSPNGVAVDAAGNLYIADTHNGRVREVNSASGLITTVAGAGVSGGNLQSFGGDGGAATAAGLALPRGLTLDPAGNLYVADSQNHRIRRISGGVVITVAGQGTQTFAGDGAPAVAASLDTPRAVAVSPAGLLTLADSDNQRVRQLDALPAPGPDIHTVAGLGTVSAGVLVLSGPSVTAYGSGTLTATLSVAGNATGAITFLDTSSGAEEALGTASLAADSAAFSLGGLNAGTHSIVATYAGNATYGPAQSSAMALTVMPLSITATPNPASSLYGQPVPALSGVLSGVLAQDTGEVAAVFWSTASTLSPAGSYPISVTLTGSAAANYAAVDTPASLTIAQAPTLTAISASPSNPTAGAAVTLTAQVSSTTSGSPTGTVTLLNGTTVLGLAPLAAGVASISTTALAAGTNSLSASYSGDSNFLPSVSTPSSIVVGPASSFTLAATGATSQSVPAGSGATFNFSVAMQGAVMASPVTLAVQGTPLGATASFNPAYLPPAGTVTSFTLTIQTPVARMENQPGPFAPGSRPSSGAAMVTILLLPVIGIARRSASMRLRSMWIVVVASASCLLLAGLASGCGNRVNTASESVGATSYTLTVTGTATGSGGTAIQQSANVTLQVL
jgi:sugar lactone lactonase YvrE